MANLVNNLPLELTNWISLGLFVLLFFFVWLLPFSRVRAPSGKTFSDIRIWASALIACQLALYAFFS